MIGVLFVLLGFSCINVYIFGSLVGSWCVVWCGVLWMLRR